MAKKIEEKYQKLDHIEHVLKRPGRYIGSIEDKLHEMYIFNETMEYTSITYNPGFLKLFDEIILNAVDESEREGSSLDTIKVLIDPKKKCISIEDNGGIPVEIHKEHKEYVPEMIFGNLMAGSNFDDSEDRVVAGTHGEGASLVNILSNKFIVETDDGKKSFKMVWENNSRKKSKPEIKVSKKNGTKITYYPIESFNDKPFFSFTDENIKVLEKRVFDIAGCKPNLKIYLNGKQIKIKSFKDYIKFYTEDFFYEENDNWQIGIAKSSTNDFEAISFVNCIETFESGTHVDYISSQVVSKIKEWIQRKKKYDIKPGEIKNHLRIFINSTIINPSFSSQTKERLTTPVKNFKTSIELSDKIINQIIKSDIIQSILDWIEAKEKQRELAELKKLNKENSKVNPKRIVKLSDASETKERDKCILMIVEGLSASLAITSARDPKYIGSYALKGKIINVTDEDNKTIANNKEFQDLIIAIGLKIGEPVKSIKDLRYGKIAFMTDADPDGAGHIVGLLCNLFFRFWPELFKMGVIYRFYTPIIKVIQGKEILDFYTLEEYNEWEKKNTKPFKAKWLKGLASSTTSDFKEYLNNMEYNLVPLEYKKKEDFEVIDLFFNKKKADERKEYLGILKEEKK